MTKIVTEKYITDSELKETLIGKWQKIKGYDLYICELWNQLFCHNLRLVHGKPKEFLKYMKEVFGMDDGKGHDDTSALYAWVERDGERYKFLCAQVLDFYPADYGSIAHELHHFVHAELKQRGVVYSDDSEEVFAYYQGHFMDLSCRAFNILRKQVIKKVKRRIKRKK